MLKEKWVMSMLLLLAPVAWAAHEYEWGDLYVFSLNFIVMIPMAAILGDFTEEAAEVVGPTYGGLLNATFGNAAELVVCFQALRYGQISVVQSMLIGSILSNLLLVLGSSFLLGGIKHHEQKFNASSAAANGAVLLLSGLALLAPTPLSDDSQSSKLLVVSRISAIAMVAMYIQLLVFQLWSHKDMFDEDDAADVEKEIPTKIEDGTEYVIQTEHHSMSISFSLFGLGVMTLLITFFSDYLVDSITGFTTAAHLSKTFVGLILLPIVGNVVEHLTAISMAIKDKMEIAMGIAVGSGTQVSMFVVPTVTLFGWMIDQPMSLKFPTFEITIYIYSVVIVAIIIARGTSTWIFGSMLVTMYLMLATSVFFIDEVE